MVVKIKSKTNREPFDPTVCFEFFERWYYIIEDLEVNINIDTAMRMFDAIADYSMYDEKPNFTDSTYLAELWVDIEKEIDESIRRRKRFFSKDTIDEDAPKIIDALEKHPNASDADIANLTGTSKNMVKRVRRKYCKILR